MMIKQVTTTLSGIDVVVEQADGTTVTVQIANDEIVKSKDIHKLAAEKLAERLKVLAAADQLRGT